MVRRLLLGLVLGFGCVDLNLQFVGPGSTGEPPSTTTAPVTTTTPPTTTTGLPAETTDDPAGSTSGSSTLITTMTDPSPTTGETTQLTGTDGTSETSAGMTMGGVVCGDGKLEQDEQCDDGNAEDLDDCNNECISAYCGDNVKQLEEDCDDGNNMDETDDCLTKCVAAGCGDGLVWANVEQCDDGNLENGDGCEGDCLLTPKFVFVTSMLYNGDFGGLFGADFECQKRAFEGGLPGEYQAWLSDIMDSPAKRMSKWEGRYVLHDGETVVADDWADLVSGDIGSPINQDEFGEIGPQGDACVPSAVYTNTKPDGTSAGGPTSCANWMLAEGSSWWGDAIESGKEWSDACKSGGCEKMAALYCFEQ